MNCLLVSSYHVSIDKVMKFLVKYKVYIHVSLMIFWAVMDHYTHAVEYTYYISREGESQCKADGSRPYEGIMKKLFCTEQRVGKSCENDKFCNETNNERCLCHNRCEELRCTVVKPTSEPQCSVSNCIGGKCIASKCWQSTDCASTTCFHLGSKKCYQNDGKFVCECQDGYDGSTCSSVKDVCYPMPCRNNGTCTDLTKSQFFCKCIPGFTGKFCEKVDHCYQFRCENNMTCHINTTDGKPYCACPYGKTGPYCEKEYNECEVKNLCERGNCSHANGTYYCRCMYGWVGARCDKRVDFCKKNPCKNGGHCLGEDSGFKCVCQSPFTGRFCSKNITDCDHLDSNPCLHGKCQTVNKESSYTCLCDKNWKGRNCSEPIKKLGHCSKNPCVNGMCKNYGDFVKCFCYPGFIGEKCDIKNTSCIFNNCQNNAVCVPNSSGYSCNCKPGFTGKFCDTNINECLANKCVRGICVDLNNKYKCQCPPEYTGEFCEVKKPQTDNCKSTCNTKQGVCVKKRCVCLANYVGINCNKNSPCDCMNNGTCLSTDQKCQCQKGYYGSKCQYVRNQCGNCNSSGTEKCTNYVGGYFCHCKDGFHGTRCEKAYNFCQNKYCGNGVCINKENPTCSCQRGFSGSNCTIPVKTCQQNPCLYGQCQMNGIQYSCICKKYYEGDNCDRKIDLCKNVTCKNSGKCVDGKCSCNVGFEGKNCEINKDDCSPNICGKNGQCNDLDNGYECICKAGYNGKQCSFDMETCMLCRKNGGKCLEGETNYECSCPAGFTGRTCETEESKCPFPECSQKFDGKTCNPKCNIHQCDWDGTDCSLGLSPWDKCKASKCWERFGNNICDQDCNNEDCFFDNFDCAPKRSCKNDTYCRNNYNNSICNPECNTQECAFDNLDCSTKTIPKKVPGVLLIDLYTSIEEFKRKQTDFQRQLSITLNSNVNIIDVQTVKEESSSRKRRSSNSKSITRIKASLDNANCVSGCFKSTQGAAKYLAAKASKGELQLPFKLRSVKGESNEGKQPKGFKWFIIVGSLCGAIFFILIVVLAGAKRVRSKLWTPSQSHTGQRSGPDGQEGEEMITRDQSSSESLDSARAIKHFKTESMIGAMDSQEWLNGYAIEPQRQHHPFYQQEHVFLDELKKLKHANIEWIFRMIDEGIDVNMRDIDGRTPLHLSLHIKEVFQRLVVNRKSHLDLQSNDGKTALMEACQYFAPEFAEELLNNCAKVTIVDNNGQSALHHAAKCDNSTQCLLLLRANAKIDLQDNKGQSPLFLAARDNCQKAAYVLHRHCANVNCCDSMDISPVAIARKNGHTEIVHMLSDTTGSPGAMTLSPSGQSPQYIMPSPNTPTYIQPKTNNTNNRGAQKHTSRQKKKSKKSISVNVTNNLPTDTGYTFPQEFDVDNCVNNFPEEWVIEPFNFGQLNNFIGYPTPSSAGIESPHDINSPNYIPTPFLTPSPETWSPGSS